MAANITTGSDTSLAVTLYKNGATFNIPGTAVVKAMLVSSNHRESYTTAIAQLLATPGANWAASLVVVLFTAAQTAGIIFQGDALLEIKVVDGTSNKTWFAPVTLAPGRIP